MKIAIMQPYIFPYIGYFQLINAVDKFIILDDVNFIMKGWINRNRILVNGRESLFSIPIKKASQNKFIYECELDENKWKDKFLKTIEHSYKKAPFYKSCIEVISSVILKDDTNLSNWLTFQIKTICCYLEINTDIVDSSRIYANNQLKAQEKIIDICKQEKAQIYVNAIGGKNLYNAKDFERSNIELYFLKSKAENYSQFNVEFVPFLSIIDIMMFNNKENIKNQLKKYELI
ncbi:MAG: hypothetical protein EPN88_09405 [Bacteroidetes bacterium]|nr:MAG: hypothetical protein EPN88_09405 [Bacteroidota bacterium]